MPNISDMQTTTSLPSYLFATVEKQELASILSKLKDIAYVDWFGSTSGRFDFVDTFKGNDMRKTDAAIKEIRTLEGVVSTNAMVPFEGQSNSHADDQRAMGQMFLSVDRPTQEVIQSLKNVPGVTEALAIPGRWEIPTEASYRARSSQQWHPWDPGDRARAGLRGDARKGGDRDIPDQLHPEQRDDVRLQADRGCVDEGPSSSLR